MPHTAIVVWFVFVGLGLVLVVICGLYARRRIGDALALLGVGKRPLRIFRWLMAWLLFGYPLVVIIAVAIALLLGRSTIPRFEGTLAVWLLGFPFAWAVLVTLQSIPWLVALDVAHLASRRRWARHRAIAVLAIVGVFALYTPIRILADLGDLRVREHRVGRGSTAFRIAFIADVQQDDFTDAARASEVYAIVNARAPDVVFSGGDWINAGPAHIASAAATAAQLKSRLGTFSVRGDHEHFAYVDRERSVAEIEQAMRANGISMITNEVRWFEHAGKRIAVVFLNYNYIVRVDRSAVEALLASVALADYKIAVTHQLDDKLAAQLEGKVDLVLGAHTHGGQINPVVGVTHVELARLETRYIDGRYERGKTTMIITAGVGYSIIPFRYASPGSIEIIDLML